MGYLGYVLVTVILATSFVTVFVCIVRGKGISRIGFVISASLLCVVAVVCFGGQAILAHFGMGWRCAPYNAMLRTCSVLFVLALCFGLCAHIDSKDPNPAVVGFGFLAVPLVISITLLSTFFYFQFSSWNDGLTTYNDQTIVYSNDQHGGSCEWRYYTHINDLVHGAEILQEVGWIGNPPHNYRSSP